MYIFKITEDILNLETNESVYNLLILDYHITRRIADPTKSLNSALP